MKLFCKHGHKVLSLILALCMILAALPPLQAQASEGKAYAITDADGKETDVFTVGDPVYMEADYNVHSHYSEGDWMALYKKPAEGESYASRYFLWFYVSDLKDMEDSEAERTNIFDLAAKNTSQFDGSYLEPGEYELFVNNVGSAHATFTLVAPEDTSVKSLKVEKNTISLGETIRVEATNYSSRSFVGLYPGNLESNFTSSGQVKSLDWYWCIGHNGQTKEFTVTEPGEYTVFMFNDYGATQLTATQHITVTDDSEPTQPSEPETTQLLATDKKVYTMGDPIMVTSNIPQQYSAGWIGLYRKGDTYDPNAGGAMSLYWYNVTVGESTTQLNADANKNDQNLQLMTAGDYTVVLFQDGGYTPVSSVDITIESVKPSTEPKLSTDKKSYTLGEAIMVTSDVPEEYSAGWIGLYRKGDTYDPNAGGAMSLYWYNVTVGQSTNQINTVANQNAQNVQQLTAGDYTVVLFSDSSYNAALTVDITLTEAKDPEPEATPSMTADKQVYMEGDAIMVTSTIPEKYTTAWIGLYHKGDSYDPYNGGVRAMYWYYAPVGTSTNQLNTSVNAHWQDVQLTPGEYTIVLFPDDSKYETCATIDITVEELVTSVDPAMTTDKKSYTPGESILVTSTVPEEYKSPWIGLYHKGDKYDPYNGGVQALSWYYVPSGVNTKELKTSATLAEGEYTIVMFSTSGYDVACTVDVTLRAAEPEIDMTLTTDKESYTTDEAIMVTTEIGEDYTSAWVGLYKNGDKFDPDNGGEQAFYLYSAKVGKNTVQLNADENKNAWSSRKLTAGNYTVVLFQGEGYEPVRYVDITITQADTPEEPKLSTDRKTYTLGEAIMVTTDVPESYTTAWVGLYKKGDTYDPNDGGAMSFYWYTVKSGESTAQLNKDANKNEWNNAQLTAGEYKVVLFRDEGYDEVCSVDITIQDIVASTEAKLSLNKESYAAGEAIMVMSDVPEEYSAGWIGLYRRNATYDPAQGGSRAMYWYYVTVGESTSQINVAANAYAQDCDLVAGDYKIVMFKDGGYNVACTVNFTITKEITSTEHKDPTCEETGYDRTYYSDGTMDETILGVLGHDYSEEWTFDKVYHTHCHVCANDPSHVSDAGSCTFDEGVVTRDATDDVPGIITYTCSVCANTYTAEFYNKKVSGESYTTAPTCEEPGVLRTTYTDGSYVENWVAPLGHDYGDWQHDDNASCHYKVCKNDKNHVITEECKTGKGVVSGKTVTYTCSVCQGSYVTSILETDKDTYIFEEEPIYVTAYASKNGAWVGLYKKGENPNYATGGNTVSFYWFYVVNGSTDNSGVAIDLMDPQYGHPTRKYDLEAGEYTIMLFEDSGYNIIATKDITIVDNTLNTKFSMSINDEVMENNQHVDIPEEENISMRVTADGGLGKSWVSLYKGKLNQNTEFSQSISKVWWSYTKDLLNKEIVINSVATLDPGDYTLVIFADGGYNYPVSVVTFSIVKDMASQEVIKEPTCVDYGIRKVTYKDGTTEYLPIDPLGHDVNKQDWAFDRDTHSHSQECARCGETITVACTFEVEIIDEATEESDGLKRYTCTTCQGSYNQRYTLDDEKEQQVSRIYGKNRYATAIAIAEQLKDNLGVEKFDTIFIASGTSFADALSGAYLANQKNAPILLSYGQEGDYAYLDTNNIDYIKENLAEDGMVYILGGTAAVPASYEDALSDYQLKRLSGKTRYETNLLILKEAGVTGGEILVCTGNNFADSLSASAINKPILMVGSDLLDSQTEFLGDISSSRFYIIGGQAAVSYSIESDLRSMAATMRISGKNRFETSARIAQRFFGSAQEVIVANGMSFPDGLCGGMLANSMNAPVVLTHENYSDSAKTYLAGLDVQTAVVLGGVAVVADTTVRDILRMDADQPIQSIFHE